MYTYVLTMAIIDCEELPVLEIDPVAGDDRQLQVLMILIIIINNTIYYNMNIYHHYSIIDTI